MISTTAPVVETRRIQGFELWDAEQHAQAVPGFIRVIGHEVNYSYQYARYVDVLIIEVAKQPAASATA